MSVHGVRGEVKVVVFTDEPRKRLGTPGNRRVPAVALHSHTSLPEASAHPPTGSTCGPHLYVDCWQLGRNNNNRRPSYRYAWHTTHTWRRLKGPPWQGQQSRPGVPAACR